MTDHNHYAREVYFGGVETIGTPHLWIKVPTAIFQGPFQNILGGDAHWEWAHDYLGGKVHFANSGSRFGFSDIGEMTYGDAYDTVRLPLAHSQRREVLLTLYIFLRGLDFIRQVDTQPNFNGREQVLSIVPEFGNLPKEHRLWGQIFGPGHAAISNNDAELAASVGEAMLSSWIRVAPPQFTKHAKESRLVQHDDRRPELTCFGNDVISGVMEHHMHRTWQISSDNIDHDYQLLTLLAGWLRLLHELRKRVDGVRHANIPAA